MWLRRESQAVPFLGVDYATARLSGVLFLRSDDHSLQVIRVFPGTPAARVGLLGGDLFESKNPDGSRRTPTEITEAIGTGQRVHVVRKTNNHSTEIDLPVASVAPSYSAFAP